MTDGVVDLVSGQLVLNGTSYPLSNSTGINVSSSCIGLNTPTCLSVLGIYFNNGDVLEMAAVYAISGSANLTVTWGYKQPPFFPGSTILRLNSGGKAVGSYAINATGSLTLSGQQITLEGSGVALGSSLAGPDAMISVTGFGLIDENGSAIVSPRPNQWYAVHFFLNIVGPLSGSSGLQGCSPCTGSTTDVLSVDGAWIQRGTLGGGLGVYSISTSLRLLRITGHEQSQTAGLHVASVVINDTEVASFSFSVEGPPAAPFVTSQPLQILGLGLMQSSGVPLKGNATAGAELYPFIVINAEIASYNITTTMDEKQFFDFFQLPTGVCTPSYEWHHESWDLGEIRASLGRHTLAATLTCAGITDQDQKSMVFNVFEPSEVTVTCGSTAIPLGFPTSCKASVNGHAPIGKVSWSASGSNGVSFSSNSCILSSGECQVIITGSSPGPVTLMAAYGGDSANNPSTATFSANVVSGVVVSCGLSSAVVGSSTRCTAKVAGSSPTGKVTFSSEGPGRLSAHACKLSKGACSVKYTPTSANSPLMITASYAGDEHNPSSVGKLAMTVTQKVSKTTVTCTPSSAVAYSRTNITCRVKVTGYSPKGTVTWSQSGTGSVSFSSTTCALTEEKCTVTMRGTTAGSVAITASYSGDSNNQGSSKTATLIIRA